MSDQPPYNPYNNPTNVNVVVNNTPTDGLAVASMVLGIVALVLFCCYGISLILGIIGAIFGGVSLHNLKTSGKQGKGMAIAGLVTSIVSLVPSAIWLVLLIIGTVSAPLSN